MQITDKSSPSYQRACIRVVLVLLSIWAIVSFGCGILFRDWLDVHAPPVGNAPFGFSMAQQGSIIIFVLILVAYAVSMGLLDEKHGYDERSEREGDS
jgi:putative solute:sodium symporter small subunit